MNGAAMRAFRTSDILDQFHPIEGPSKIAGRYGLHHCIAFVANDVSDIVMNDAIQTAATLRISEIRMRERRSDDVFVSHADDACPL